MRECAAIRLISIKEAFMETQKHKFQWLPMLALAFAYGATYNPPYIRYIVYDTMLEALGCTNAQLGFLTTF